MNILEIEDMIKGLPDQALQREAQMPSGQVPQFLVVSEIQRRGDMRKRFQERQPQGTIKDQVIQEGIAAMAPPEPQMQSAMMGMQQSMPQAMPPQMQMQQPQMVPPMQMAEGRAIPFPDDPRLSDLRAQGLTDEQIAQEIRRLGLNEERMAQLGLPTIGTMEATMQPDAYSQDAYADIFARQQGNIPAGMEFIEPRTTDDLLSPQVGFTTREMAQSQTLPNVPVERPAPSQRGIGSAPEGTADALQAQIQALRSTPASPAAQADFAMPDFAMPDFASYRQAINTALASPPGTGRRDVGNFLGSDMPALSSVDGSAPVSAPPAVDTPDLAAQLIAESQARRGTEPSAAVGTFDAPAPQDNALIEQLIAGSEARRGREPSPAVGTFNAPLPENTALIQELIAGSEARRNQEPSPAIGTFDTPAPENNALIQELIAGSEARRGREPSSAVGDFSQSINDSPRRQAMLASMERIREAQENAPLLPFIPEGTKSQIIARGRENPILSQIEEGAAADDLARNRERMLASLEGTPLEGIYDSPLSQSPRVNVMDLIKIAENQSGAVQTDGGRGFLTGSATDPEVVETALAGDTSSSLSNRSATVDEKDTNRTGTGGGKAVQGTGSAEGRLAGRVGEGSEARERLGAGAIRRAGELQGRMSLAQMIENQERPTLSYQGLISDFEKQMESQLADIKREKGSQALIALGAGIARGDLGAGLSDAGKAAAASNAQKRALEARQQAMQMGLRKSEIDAAFQSEVQKQANKLEAQKTRISALESYGAKQDAAEQAVLNFENGIDTTLANIGVKRDYYDQLSEQQKETSRRAILNYVEGIISRQNMAGQDKQAQDAMRQQLLREAANILNVPVGEISGSTNKGEGEDQVIEFDDQGKRI